MSVDPLPAALCATFDQLAKEWDEDTDGNSSITPQHEGRSRGPFFAYVSRLRWNATSSTSRGWGDWGFSV